MINKPLCLDVDLKKMQNSGGGFLHPSLFRRVELRVNQTTCDYRVNNLYNGYASRYRQTEGGTTSILWMHIQVNWWFLHLGCFVISHCMPVYTIMSPILAV